MAKKSQKHRESGEPDRDEFLDFLNRHRSQISP
jgi:hypothetical protein